MLNKTDQKAIPLLSAGLTQQDVADQLGITQPGVHKIANKNEVKKQVQAAQLIFIQSGIDIAIENQLYKLNAGKAILSNQTNTNQKDDDNKPQPYINGVDNAAVLALADKVEARLMQSVGILPSHTQSQVYINLIATGNITLVDPGVKAALQGYTDDLFNDDVQEADIEPSP